VPNCKKQAPPPHRELPPITEQGKNTIGFMVDGEIWLPNYECNIGSDPCGKLDVFVRSANINVSYPLKIDLTAANDAERDASAFIIGVPDDNNGISTIGEKIDSIKIEYFVNGDTYRRYPGIGFANDFFKVTMLDIEKRIFSAVFDLWLYKRVNDKKDSVHLSNGRLDTKFSVCECDH
jgi:hypothetical protein